MDDLISRQVAIDALDKCHCGGKDENGRTWIYKENAVEAIEMVEPSPTAEPKRIRAKWIATTSLQEGQITWRDYKCSNCSHHRGKPMNYCEVCGAKMER